MSTETTEVLLPSVDVSAKVEITNQDLVNVAVARQEQLLLARDSELELLAKNLQKNHEKLQKDFRTSLDTVDFSELTAKAKRLASVYSVFGTKVTAKVTPAYDFNHQDKTVGFNVSLVTGNGERAVLTLSQRLPATQTTLDVLEQQQANSNAIAQCSEDRMKVKRDLSRLSTLERQARAAVTEAALGGSEKGRQLLKSLQDGIPNLPKLIA